jgi:hypothetical protein
VRTTALALCLVLAAPTAAGAQALELVCQGQAVHLEDTQTYVSGSDNHGNTVDATGNTFRKERSDAQVRVRLDGAGGGKVKLPRALVPKISIGKDGWWDFTKLTVTDDQIKGQISLNLINHPSIVIDRHTGDMDMKGFGGSFSGSCERAPEAPEERKF